MTITPDQPFANPEVNAYLEDWGNNAGLRHLVAGLAREDPFLEGGPNWVTFLADDAQIEAGPKLGMNIPVLSIDAYLLSTDDIRPSEEEVQAWIERQPSPALGRLTTAVRQRDDRTVEYLPLLSVDAHLDSILADFMRDLISLFAEAWDSRTITVLPDRDLGGGDGDGGVYRYRPADVQPRNAWLLMGSEASYPTTDDLTEQWEQGQAGLFDEEWTAPKNGELGDLVLFYFVAPRKAACFVARLASRPYWQTDVEVNAVKAVDPHQWWAVTSPLIEIEPIPYKTLQDAADGHLPLRGRSGHYLSPRTISSLTFVAKDPARQSDVDQIAQLPSGNPDVPEPIDNLDAWRAIPGGALPLEAKVSEHVVEPLIKLLWGPNMQWAHEHLIEPTLGPIPLREHRVPSGLVDFVFEYAGQAALAVEVKLTVLRPAAGVWSDSRDFQQLLRYMRDLDLPGLLIDAQRLLLVKRGDVVPFAEIIRTAATWEDLALIRDLLLEGRWGSSLAPPSSSPSRAPARRTARRG